MNNVLVLTLAIVVVILVAGAVLGVAVGRRQERKNRALSVIAGGGVPVAGKERAQAKNRADIARKLKEAGKDAARQANKGGVSARDLMLQAGYDAPVSRYWIWAAVAAAVVWLAVSGMTSLPPVAVILVACTAFFTLPRMFLKFKAGRRQKKFLSEFPDALEASVRLLQAGMPITEAIAMVSREYTGPIREEMMRVYENQKIGMPLGEAAQAMARRIPLPEVHMFATALQIQSETGSSLSEVLSNLAGVIRARFRLKRKVKALSSEAKASASIIASLPVLVAFGLYMVRPEYIGVLFTSTGGKTMLAGCGLWMGMGILVMRQMINFKV